MFEKKTFKITLLYDVTNDLLLCYNVMRNSCFGMSINEKKPYAL